MKKRLLGILIAVAMVICAIPMTASAGGSAVVINRTGLVSGYTYSQNGDNKLPEIINDGTLKYVYDNSDDSATLYLNSVCISANDGYPIISSDASKINIVLTGENKLTTTDKIYCIKGENITLSGTGSLDLDASADGNGICTDEGYITIEGVKITAKTRSNVIDARDVVNINGAAVVDVTSVEAYAITAKNGVNFNLTSGGSVKACSNNSDEALVGAVMTYATGTINLAANNVITLPENGVVAKNDTYAYIAASASADPAKSVTVEYVASTTKPAGANTGDTNNITMFSILGILALCGAGFVYKKREN